jgi:LysM repeat protein
MAKHTVQTDASGRHYIVVAKGDTLSAIAVEFKGAPYNIKNYQQLAAINSDTIKDPNKIYTKQKIYLEATPSGSSSGTSSNSTKPIIKQFGLLSTDDNVLFATWEWSKSNTASYKVLWTYDTGDGVWFEGTNSNDPVDKDAPELSKQSTYTIPSNAKKVRFKVKPISETKKKDDKETSYWTADWSSYNDGKIKTEWSDSTPLDAPTNLSVKIEKYKLTVTLDNIDIAGATHIEFQVVKDNAATPFATKKAEIVSAHASHVFTVDAGSEYKVRCRAYSNSNKTYSDWSDYSDNKATMPAATSGITSIKAASKTSVTLEWAGVTSATSYDIQYATKKEYFDYTDLATTKTGIEFTKYEITGLESGFEYFFRVRATNTEGSSAWSEPKSIIVGTDPAAPTTWSSTTTAIVGEEVFLYWIHNTEDGSSQTYAELELTLDGQVVSPTYTIKNFTDEKTQDNTRSCVIDTLNGYVRWDDDTGTHEHSLGKAFVEGTKLEWRVRTKGITNAFGDWSIQRAVDIYAPATLQLNMTNVDGGAIDTLQSFPFYIYGLAGPSTQVPIGYHLTITSNEIYETVDNIGNPKVVTAGEAVYSKYFDIKQALLVEMSASNIDLENNISYTVTCVVSMNSGLTAESSLEFTVSWTDIQYKPNAELSVDDETLTAYIRPYCEETKISYHKVTLSNRVYTVMDDTVSGVYGELVKNAITSTGELVYRGITADGEETYYCMVEERTRNEDVLLSVYRREFDGSFTELASGLDNADNTTVSDPHPALDYARYRIVATSKNTGAVSYYDPPGYPVGGISVVIQWDEKWTSFETSEEAAMEQPAWSGSMLKLPYNIDVSDSNDPDVAHINYFGRKHPVSYYGTHLGEKSTWNVEIEADDKETLYALRRLKNWLGDVYVREPSGSGYWASVTVSFSQKHCGLTIPVTLDIIRVEGGM